MIESEIKFEFKSREAFLKASRYFEERSAAAALRENQVNHYLDTADLRLARVLVMLRLRAGKKNILTLKSGTQMTRGHFRAREVEAEIDDEVLRRMLSDPASIYDLDLAPVQALYDEFGELALRKIGALNNTRTTIQIEGFTVELDGMDFPDGSQEFELEIEAEDSDKARQWCCKHFQVLGLDPVPSTETKFQRLLRKITPAANPIEH